MMAKTDFKSVDEYIASLPPETHLPLRRVRAVIKKALPKRAPGMREGPIPATAKLLKAMKKELAPHLHSKATLRFSYDEKVPAALIARIAKTRAAEVSAAVKA